MRCANCCKDLDIPLLHLVLPHVYLDEHGLEFYKAHGLFDVLKRNEVVEFQHGDLVFKVPILAVIRPDLFLDAAGQEFMKEHHLDELLKSLKPVRLKHRCDKLTDDNLCGIYPIRPDACRTFDCSTRADHFDSGDHTFPLEFKR